MARLPFSVDRLEGREINLRRESLPVQFRHPVRDIDDYMDDIVYNAIDLIQERAPDNELRTFYYNLMSVDGWRNRDFEDIIGIIADIIDIGVQEGRFRDVKDAVIPVTEDIIQTHIGYMTDVYPALMQFVDRRNERNVDTAIRQFERFQEVCRIYRRNGSRIPDRRDRRDYDDRRDYRRGDRYDRGYDRRVNYGDRGDSRRDSYNRSAIRNDYRSTSRNRDNRFGNTDQSDRFDDVRTNERTQRDDIPQSRIRRDDREERSTIQRMPMQRDSDIDDVLKREGTKKEVKMANQHPKLLAEDNMDAWMPTEKYPHLPVLRHKDTLQLEMDMDSNQVIPVVETDDNMDYWKHESIAFGSGPRDKDRLEDYNAINKRIEALHNSINHPTEEFEVEGSEESVTYHNRYDIEGSSIVSFNLEEAFTKLEYKRFCKEHDQPTGGGFHEVSIVTGTAKILDFIGVTPDEKAILEDIRGANSMSMVRTKLNANKDKLRLALFTWLNKHLTDAVNHALHQYLSIPTLRITSFVDDWTELQTYICNEYGQAYRDALIGYQFKILNGFLRTDVTADLFMLMHHKSENNVEPFAFCKNVKLFHINETIHQLDIDMMPGMSSQLMSESHPFFHDLVKGVLDDNDNEWYYIQTADRRIIEVSQSFLNDKAILMRVVK